MELKSKVYTRKNASGTHYARIVVPKQLQAFARPAIWKSLSTADAAEARTSGILVAIGTRSVLQAVADEHADAEAAVILMDVEVLDQKIDDLDAYLSKIDVADLEVVTASLRKALGIKSGDGDKSSNNGGGGCNGGTGGASTSTTKNSAKAPKKLADVTKTDSGNCDTGSKIACKQSASMPLLDSVVEHYIEKRPHGVFRFRFWVPLSQQSSFGQREVRCSLSTSDRFEAIQKAKPLFLDVRRRLDGLPAASRTAHSSL